jgi:hypothetical protein
LPPVCTSSVICIAGDKQVNSIDMKETGDKEKYWEVPIHSLTVLTAYGESAQWAGTLYGVRCNVLMQLSLKYIIIIIRLLSQAFSSWLLSWTSSDPHHSGFKLHFAVLSVLCVMFQV